MARVMPIYTSPPTTVDDYLKHTSFNDLKKTVLEYLRRDYETTKDDLYRLICVELDYCEAKTKGTALIGLLGAVVNHYVALAVAAFPHLWVLPAAVAYLSKKYLDKLCGCN